MIMLKRILFLSTIFTLTLVKPALSSPIINVPSDLGKNFQYLSYIQPIDLLHTGEVLPPQSVNDVTITYASDYVLDKAPDMTVIWRTYDATKRLSQFGYENTKNVYEYNFRYDQDTVNVTFFTKFKDHIQRKLTVTATEQITCKQLENKETVKLSCDKEGFVSDLEVAKDDGSITYKSSLPFESPLTFGGTMLSKSNVTISVDEKLNISAASYTVKEKMKNKKVFTREYWFVYGDKMKATVFIKNEAKKNIAVKLAEYTLSNRKVSENKKEKRVFYKLVPPNVNNLREKIIIVYQYR